MPALSKQQYMNILINSKGVMFKEIYLLAKMWSMSTDM